MGQKNSSLTTGYRVLGVQANSPGRKANLISFFDFIIAADGQAFEEEGPEFFNLIRAAGSSESPLKLTVYNTKSRSVRETTIYPRTGWGGKGLLGITIRFDEFDDCTGLHVLDVVQDSPAYAAGLVSYEDYILGTAREMLTMTSELAYVVEDHMYEPLGLWVYNATSDIIRLAFITPNDQWPGEGSLGCDVGEGYLHALPNRCRATIGITRVIDAMESKNNNNTSEDENLEYRIKKKQKNENEVQPVRTTRKEEDNTNLNKIEN
eukprot:g937.t1